MQQTPSSPVLLSVANGIARVRFNRPDVLNAIDTSIATGFLETCRHIAAHPDVRVVVLQGEGRAFVAGGDLAQFRQAPLATAHALIEPMHEAIALMTQWPMPVIASLHGAVAGAGLSLALACDLAIAAEGTRFNLAYVNVATNCDVGASWHLPRLVGLRKALEIALLGDTFAADEALRLGLVNRVVPAADLADETTRWAERLARGAPIAQGRIKQLLRESANRTLPQQLDAERAGFEACAQTADFAEALEAFFTKRPAQFTGR